MNELQLIEQFAKHMRMQYDVQHISVYKNQDKLYGDTLDCVAMEQYLSLTCTTIYKESSSCSLVSHINIGHNLYIIALRTDKNNTYGSIDVQYMINEIKELRRKIGEAD